MQSPWSKLKPTPPYVLAEDRVDINKLLEKQLDPTYAINLNSIPEPFIGLPELATVILLNLNPGDGDGDKVAHADPAFREAMFCNLTHEYQEYSFYPLNPAFAWTGAGKWWLQNLRQLFEVGGLNPATVARKLCVIEWFPYHSIKAKLPLRAVCPSQGYSFALARRALSNKLVVGMRARTRWEIVDKKLDFVPYLKNPQRVSISPRNAGEDLFWKIVSALR